MNDIYNRTELLIGDKIEKLKNSKVIICGCGGVGSYTVESLVRCGIGEITVIDKDIVDLTNINRQIIALNSTVGKDKVNVCKDRCLDINKDLKCNIIKEEITKENISKLIKDTDYVVDAIDSFDSKIALIEFCKKNNINIVSCMGMGNRLNPLDIEIGYIKDTSVCPLARKVRKVLKSKGIKKIKVVYSKENPLKKEKIGSISFVPSVAGLVISSVVIKDIIEA